MKEQVEHDLEELGCNKEGECAVEILKSQPGRKAAELIREYLLASSSDDKYIDIVLVGNKGADFSTNNEDKYLGSVANAIIKNTKLNVVFMP